MIPACSAATCLLLWLRRRSEWLAGALSSWSGFTLQFHAVKKKKFESKKLELSRLWNHISPPLPTRHSHTYIVAMNVKMCSCVCFIFFPSSPHPGSVCAAVQLCLWPLHLCPSAASPPLQASLLPPPPPPPSLKKFINILVDLWLDPAQLNNGILGTLNGLALLQRAD